MTRLLITGVTLFQLCLPVTATANDEPPVDASSAEAVQSVDVVGIRNPELQPYRHMLAGLDMFEHEHHLAPDAPVLRFLIKPKYPSESIAGLVLRIASDQT